MNERRTKKRSTFKRARSDGTSRDQAMLKNRKKRMAILKRRRRILLLMLLAVVACIVLAVMYADGAFDKKATETTLSMKPDGSLTFEEIDTLEGGQGEQELTSYVKDAIDTYNHDAGERAVRFKKCDVINGEVYLKTTYKNAAAYADFTGLDVFGGSVKEAKERGYLFNNAFVSVKDGEKKGAVKKGKVKKEEENNVLILNQPICVSVPADIVCITRDNTELLSEKAARITGQAETYIVYE